MSDKKLSPAKTLAARQAKAESEFERLVKKTDKALEHHSEGVWGWFDDTLDKVGDWIGEGVESVNDVIDTFIWDTDQDEAVVEDWVRDVFHSPDIEGESFLGEVWDYIVDDFKDNVDEIDDFIDNTIPDIIGNVDDIIDDVADKIRDAGKTVGGAITNTIEKIGDIINNIEILIPPIDLSALSPLGLLPELISGMQNDLANWFKFNPDEFKDTLDKLNKATAQPRME